jgi:catechol 2,3-dioxygenase-like lactoylglutathione lyase family enzyme
VTAIDKYAGVRCLVDDVQTAIDFYTTHLGFVLNTSAAPAFADVMRGPLRLLLSGPASSGARATPDDATTGRNRIHLIVDDLDAEIDQLRSAGLSFRSELVSGPGGRQILLTHPAGNLIELFQPAHESATRPQPAVNALEPTTKAPGTATVEALPTLSLLLPVMGSTDRQVSGRPSVGAGIVAVRGYGIERPRSSQPLIRQQDGRPGSNEDSDDGDAADSPDGGKDRGVAARGME